jgi:glucose-6-phosphate 1-dehydrogenase
MSTVTTIAPETATTAANIVPSRQVPPATLVIFGAGGDLTKRLVVPALYHLVRASKLADEFAVIGVDHSDQTTEQWRQSLTGMLQTTQAAGMDTEA